MGNERKLVDGGDRYPDPWEDLKTVYSHNNTSITPWIVPQMVLGDQVFWTPLRGPDRGN